MRPLPAYAQALGLVRATDVEGRAILHLPHAERLIGRPGFIHGGVIAGLLEMAALDAAWAAAEGVRRIKPITITVDFMRGGRFTDTYARATIGRLGGRIANVEAVCWQADEARPIGAARLNLLLVRD